MSAPSLTLELRSGSPYAAWCMESANFYGSAAGLYKPRAMCEEPEPPVSSGSSLAELSAAPAIYDDESAIDFSSYIDSMASVPNLELCNDELFADLFNSNHKGVAERGECDYLSGLQQQPAKVLKKEPEWSDSSSSLPCQIATCAQTSMTGDATALGRPGPVSAPGRCRGPS
ncbi:CCAAT enhancer binding protein (C EBP), partial [Pristimantis euphronides]